MATNPARRLTSRAWQDQFGRWIDEPEEEALLHAAVFFDFRQLHGELDAEEALRPVIRRAAGNRRFLGRLARAALRRRPPLGFLRHLRGGQRGRIDLKAQGTAPIVDLARLLALEAGSMETATVARLRSVTGGGAAGTAPPTWSPRSSTSRRSGCATRRERCAPGRRPTTSSPSPS